MKQFHSLHIHSVCVYCCTFFFQTPSPLLLQCASLCLCDHLSIRFWRRYIRDVCQALFARVQLRHSVTVQAADHHHLLAVWLLSVVYVSMSIAFTCNVQGIARTTIDYIVERDVVNVPMASRWYLIYPVLKHGPRSLTYKQVIGCFAYLKA